MTDSIGGGPPVGAFGDPVPNLMRVTVTCETADGVVATIVCEPEQSFGAPHGHPRLTIDREEIDPHRLPWAVDRLLTPGHPVLAIVASRITVKGTDP